MSASATCSRASEHRCWHDLDLSLLWHLSFVYRPTLGVYGQ